MEVVDSFKLEKIKTIFNNMEYSKTFDSDSLIKEWINKQKGELSSFINNDFKAFDSEHEEVIEFCFPQTGDKLANLHIYKACDKGKNCKIRLHKPATVLSSYDRSKILYSIARNVQKNQRLLALAESVNTGRHISSTSNTDLPQLIRCLYHYAGISSLLDEEKVAGSSQVQIIASTEAPSPIFSLCWNIFSLLASGTQLIFCVTVENFLSISCFAEICKISGLPANYFNVITTSKNNLSKVIDEINVLSHVKFVTCQTDGSTFSSIANEVECCRLLRTELKRPTAIVTESADILSAVEGCLVASYGGIGIRHGCRILVQESIFEKFQEKIKDKFGKLRIGVWNDKNADFSYCITHTESVDRLLFAIREAESEGASILTLEKTSPVYLISDIQPASVVVQKQTKGIVILLIPYRSNKDAIAIANSSPGLSVASVWSERLTVATEIARSLIAKHVWINTQNHYDQPNDTSLIHFCRKSNAKAPQRIAFVAKESLEIDETYKLYYGGGQKRPLSGVSYAVMDPKEKLITLAPKGGKKDARNAVEAANAALSNWRQKSGHARSQLLYYFAENLQKRRSEFVQLIAKMTHQSSESATQEVDNCVRDVFQWAGYCDKSKGLLADSPFAGFCLSVTEPLGVVAFVHVDSDLGVLRTLLVPAIAALACGNTVVAVASEAHPLAALSLYQILDTSDFPAGVFNILSGNTAELSQCLFDHHDVQAFWSDAASRDILKNPRCPNSNGKKECVVRLEDFSSNSFARCATTRKCIWIPSGDSFGN